MYWKRNTVFDTADHKIENSSEKPNNSTCSKMEQVDKDINARSKDEPQTCSVNGRPYSDCSSCEHFRCTADEPQTNKEIVLDPSFAELSDEQFVEAMKLIEPQTDCGTCKHHYGKEHYDIDCERLAFGSECRYEPQQTDCPWK
jgi:hypothetical protein